MRETLRADSSLRRAGAYNLQVTTPRATKTFKVTAEAKEFTDISPVSVP